MSRDKGIRVSEKHGVNPTVVLCFWCGQERGDIALLGRLPNDAEAPRRAVIDHEPCDACKERMDKGITIFECEEDGEPTGSWVVVSMDWANTLSPEEREQVLKHRKVRMLSSIFRKNVQRDTDGKDTA